jgi:hypothetical protein
LNYTTVSFGLVIAALTEANNHVAPLLLSLLLLLLQVHAPTGAAVISGRSGFSVWDIAMSGDNSNTDTSSSIVHRFRGGQAVDAPLTASSDTLPPVCEGSIIQGEEQLMFGCVSSGSSVLQVFKL